MQKLEKIRIGGSKKLIKELLKRTCDTRIGSIRISKDAVGEYWASLSIASEEPYREVLPKTGSMQGIDLNLLDLINTSDGYTNPNIILYIKIKYVQ